MADRALDEVIELFRAAKFTHRFSASTLTVYKGDPLVMICAELMMTCSISICDEQTTIRVPVAGHVARMAMALHLGLTPSEAELIGMTAGAAEHDLAAHMMESAASVGVKGGTPSTILPSDPRWIEGQRAAEPWRAPGKARRRG